MGKTRKLGTLPIFLFQAIQTQANVPAGVTGCQKWIFLRFVLHQYQANRSVNQTLSRISWSVKNALGPKIEGVSCLSGSKIQNTADFLQDIKGVVFLKNFLRFRSDNTASLVSKQIFWRIFHPS